MGITLREPLLGVAVGRKGVGKTYSTTQLVQRYIVGTPHLGVKPRRVLFFDVNDEYSHIKSLNPSHITWFSAHRKIEARRIRPFWPDGTQMGLDDLVKVLGYILKHYRGGLLIIEDPNKYISDNLPSDLVGTICSARHVDLDIIMHYQGIGRIVPKLWQNMSWLRFHKNIESVDRHKQKYPDKVELLKIAETLVDTQYAAGNKYFHLYVDLEEDKIRGGFDKSMFEMACKDYIAENYNAVIKPLLAKKSLGKEKGHNAETALKEAISSLTYKYYGN